MMRFVFMLAAVAICAVAQHEPPPAVGAAPQQPAPFSHRAHTALNLKCAECHPTAGKSRAAGMPPESLCMNCHVSVKADSPGIVALAGLLTLQIPRETRIITSAAEEAGAT